MVAEAATGVETKTGYLAGKAATRSAEYRTCTSRRQLLPQSPAWPFAAPWFTISAVPARTITMDHRERIVIDPEILLGKPVVRGTRLSVDFLLGLLAQGWTESEILRNYPGLQREDLLACWAYASEA
jgi:uncharacterized protein (DUF433 family)